MNNTVKLCDYGCGQDAKYTFKNGKNCCSKSKNSCPVLRKKNGDGTRKPRRKKPDLCDYACGQEAKFYFKLSDKWCCSKSQNSCPSIRKKLSISATGYKQSEMRKTNHSLKMKELWKNPSSKLRSKERKEKLSRWMKNGHCLKMIKAIKKISNEEIKLRDMVKELYPDCEFQFPVLRYSLDVAIPKYKIAIEYDGYYHFDCESNIEHHKKRNKRIENKGWKFLKYTIFDKFPTIDNLKTDIENLIVTIIKEDKNK